MFARCPAGCRVQVLNGSKNGCHCRVPAAAYLFRERSVLAESLSTHRTISNGAQRAVALVRPTCAPSWRSAVLALPARWGAHRPGGRAAFRDPRWEERTTTLQSWTRATLRPTGRTGPARRVPSMTRRSAWSRRSSAGWTRTARTIRRVPPFWKLAHTGAHAELSREATTPSPSQHQMRANSRVHPFSSRCRPSA